MKSVEVTCRHFSLQTPSKHLLHFTCIAHEIRINYKSLPVCCANIFDFSFLLIYLTRSQRSCQTCILWNAAEQVFEHHFNNFINFSTPSSAEWVDQLFSSTLLCQMVKAIEIEFEWNCKKRARGRNLIWFGFQFRTAGNFKWSPIEIELELSSFDVLFNNRKDLPTFKTKSRLCEWNFLKIKSNPIAGWIVIRLMCAVWLLNNWKCGISTHAE